MLYMLQITRMQIPHTTIFIHTARNPHADHPYGYINTYFSLLACTQTHTCTHTHTCYVFVAVCSLRFVVTTGARPQAPHEGGHSAREF